MAVLKRRDPAAKWNNRPAIKTTWVIQDCCTVELRQGHIGGLETAGLRIITEDGDCLYLNRKEAVELAAILVKASRSVL